MADLRHLDLTTTDKGLKVHSLVRRCVTLEASTTYNQEFIGFFSNTGAALDWTVTLIDAKESVDFTPKDSTVYNVHLSAITLPAGASGHGYLPGYRNELVDQFDDMTFDGQGDTTGNILTVPIAGSSDLTSASSVIPLVGQVYNYSVVVSSYSAATTAVISYGGTELYNKDAAGVYSGKLTATTVAPLAISVTGVATADFVVDSISITRA